MRTAFLSPTARFVIACLEIALLTVLILTTRCSNYQDVFVGGQVYFTDADCYARMTRVEMCLHQPGLVVRHHDFENYPTGITPHTTAPFDYILVALVGLLAPWSNHAQDLAGALISPILALLGGWLLWWWSRRTRLHFRWAMLILYALSPMLVHGTELGRPDHQSLLLLLFAMAMVAELELYDKESLSWCVVSGLAWGVSLWVSLYEPLVLLVTALLSLVILRRHALLRRDRIWEGLTLVVVVLFSLLVERRLPALPAVSTNGFFARWSSSIGELRHVGLFSPAWLYWCGLLVVTLPVLFLVVVWRRKKDGMRVSKQLALLLIVTYALTIWQVRWVYFFVLLFVFAIPNILSLVRQQWLGWLLFLLSLYPVLQDWDSRVWPNDTEMSRRMQQRMEEVELHAIALKMQSKQVMPFLAPWWLAPSLSYWSHQPSVAGSSHEGLRGIVDSAQFFVTNDDSVARQILRRHHVAWVVAYDADKVLKNSSAILGQPILPGTVGFRVDRAASRAPSFLQLKMQDGAGKLYLVNNF